jgi:hypothetical protein
LSPQDSKKPLDSNANDWKQRPPARRSGPPPQPARAARA